MLASDDSCLCSSEVGCELAIDLLEGRLARGSILLRDDDVCLVRIPDDVQVDVPVVGLDLAHLLP